MAVTILEKNNIKKIYSFFIISMALILFLSCFYWQSRRIVNYFFSALLFFLPLFFSNNIKFLKNTNIKHLLILGFFIRLIWIFFSNNIEQFSDFGVYQKMAFEIFQGKYYFTSYKPTGASIITSFFYKLFGVNYISGQLPILIFSTLQIYLIYLLALNIFNKKTAIVAAFLMTLNPDHVIFCSVINSEIYFSFLVMLSFLIISKNISKKNIFYFSFLVGVAQYFRPIASLVIISFIFFIFFEFKFKDFFYKSVISVFTFFLVVSPIVSYNYLNHNNFSISPSTHVSSGWSILLSSNPIYNGSYNTEDLIFLNKEFQKVKNDSISIPVQKNILAKNLGIERIKKNLGSFIFNCIVLKPYMFWGENANYNMVHISLSNNYIKLFIDWIGKVFQKILLIFSFFCILKNYYNIIDNKIIMLCIFTSIFFTFAHLFLEIQPRYHFHLIFILIILSSNFLSQNQFKIKNIINLFK